MTENLPAKQFTAALFDAYENKDLTAFLMAVCQNSMFDLLRNAFLIPFKFNADGQTNPIFLTDEEGKLLENLPIHVKEKEYEKFRKVYQKRDKVKMYLAHGYKKRHCYDSETMETQEYKMGEHDGVLLIYELPDTVKEKKTEAEAYAAVWDIMMELQKELPNSVVYYGQDFLQEEGKRFVKWGFSFRWNTFLTDWKAYRKKRIKLYMVNKKMHLVEKRSDASFYLKFFFTCNNGMFCPSEFLQR